MTATVKQAIEALERCRDELQESIENEGRLASFKAAIEKADKALTALRSLPRPATEEEIENQGVLS